MPIEAKLLRDQPYQITTCPKCGHTPFEPIQHYCALICSKCHDIVDYESPFDEEQDILREQNELETINPKKYPLYINKIWKYEVNKQKFLEKLKNPKLMTLVGGRVFE